MTQDIDGPEPGDYIISSNGFRLSVSICEGCFLLETPHDATAEAAIRQHAAGQAFFPDVWQVSDHGNLSLYGVDLEPFPWLDTFEKVTS